MAGPTISFAEGSQQARLTDAPNARKARMVFPTRPFAGSSSATGPRGSGFSEGSASALGSISATATTMYDGRGPAPSDPNIKVKYDYWDPTPYSHIPIISKPLQPLPMPGTRIPSPLSRNLHPSDVIDLYLFLCGPQRKVGPRDALGYQSRHGGSGNAYLTTVAHQRNGRAGVTGWTTTGNLALGNGKIIWKAWKRAFDIWNNYYIEGRVNEDWVGKRLLEAEDEEQIMRHLRFAQPMTVGPLDGLIFPPSSSFISQKESARQDAELNVSLFMTKVQQDQLPTSPDKMDFERSESSGIVEMPWVVSILQGMARRQVGTKPDKTIKVVVKHNSNVLVSDSNVGVANIILIDPKDTMDDPKDSLYRIDTQGVIATERTQKAIPLSDHQSTMIVVDNRPGFVTEFKRIIERIHAGSNSDMRLILRPYRDETTGALPQDKSLLTFIINPLSEERMITDECYLIDAKGRSTDTGEEHRIGVSPWTGQFIKTTDVQEIIRTITDEHKAKKAEDDLALTIRKLDSATWLLLLNWSYIRDTDITKIIDGKGRIRDAEDSGIPEPTTAFSVWENADLSYINPSSEVRPMLNEKQREQDNRAFGDGGGFFAMKNLPEYAEPDYDLPADVSWIDGVENSVWMPYRAGEMVTDIKIDQDLDKAGKKFEHNGGVDCSRNPHKLLDHIVKPGKANQVDMVDLGVLDIELVKTWDGITGKVFNIPVCSEGPPKDPMQIEDEHARLVREKYSKKLRLTDMAESQSGFFPLDIRRLEKVNRDYEEGGSRSPPGDVHSLAGDDMGFAGFGSVDLDMTDITDPNNPWFITPKQKSLRKQVNRGDSRWMDHEKLQHNHLITDDRHWKRELAKDDERKAQYFVANLDGRTLIANGLEIKKGHVAGPLPPFVVFECPGSNIVFWWGTDHREHSGNLEGDERWEAAWAVARRRPGWKYMAMNTGEAWDLKIKEMQTDVAKSEALWPEEWNTWRESARAARDEKVNKTQAESAKKDIGASHRHHNPHSPPDGPGDGGFGGVTASSQGSAAGSSSGFAATGSAGGGIGGVFGSALNPGVPGGGIHSHGGHHQAGTHAQSGNDDANDKSKGKGKRKATISPISPIDLGPAMLTKPNPASPKKKLSNKGKEKALY